MHDFRRDFSIEKLRKEYSTKEFRRKDLSPSPFDQFRRWFADAIEAQIAEPNAMALSTASKTGKPSCRMVLMKHFDEQGLVFFTNYESRKAQELHENPNASALFFWKELERQIHIEGRTEKVSQEESYSYFSKRPRGSQLGAWASHQDEVISSREKLEKEYNRLEEFYNDQEIPLPYFWGGFKIIPSCFEFWQGRKDRLHDRFRYKMSNLHWIADRLSP